MRGACTANLVRISAREVSRFAAHARKLASSVEDAVEAEADARAKARSAVQVVVITALVVEVLFVIGGWVEATLASSST